MREGVPGYPMGEIPPVPLFQMPDLSMLDSSMAGFSIKVRDKFPSVPGVTIRPARCDKGGEVETDNGSLLFYGDGSGTYTDGNGEVVNYGNGAGNYTINGTKVTVYGDGSGSYEKGEVKVISYGDGSGTYDDGATRVVLYATGAGNYTNGETEIINNGDGSGSYTNGPVDVTNYGDGSGYYKDDTIEVINYGNRTGRYTNADTGEDLALTPEPIAPIAPLGKFPTMGSLKPIKSCGTRITIDDSVLFDFNKDTLRPAAKETMTTLARLFTDLKIARATISGHTDAIGTDEYNQDLSERRANSVKAALLALNVPTTLDAVGYGETKPVAPNQLNGKDDPAGRQANRRVEIFIPNS
jgi:OOP family OmpA-OmpF porin